MNFFVKIDRINESVLLWKDIFYRLILEYFKDNYKKHEIIDNNEKEIIEFIKMKVIHNMGIVKSKVKSVEFLEKMYQYLEYEPKSIEHGAYLGKII